MKILVAATAPESKGLVQAAASLGCACSVVAPDEDLAAAIVLVRPDVVVASVAGAGDVITFARRLRAIIAPARLVLLVEAGTEGLLQPWADALLLRAQGPRAAIERALALRAPLDARGDVDERLAAGIDERLAASIDERLAASIDERLEIEMHQTLTDVGTDARSRPPRHETAPAMVSGNLSEEDLAPLLGRLFTTAATGRLRVVQGDTEKTISLEAGRPVCASSTDAGDRLVAMLGREGQLSAAQQTEAVRTADATGKRMGALLVELGMIKPSELLVIVRRHYEEILLSLFPWSTGTWTFEPGLVTSPERVRLLRHPGALVREGLSRARSAYRLQGKLGSARNVFRAAEGPQASDLFAEVLSAEAERRLPGLLDGMRSLGEVARVSGLPESQLHESLYALWCFGLVTPAGEGAAQSSGERDRVVERARVLARHALAQESDYFQVLGIDRLADTTDVRRAFERLWRENGPHGLDPGVAAELGTELELVREVLTEAVRVLGNTRLRAEYEAHLPDDALQAGLAPGAATARG